MLPEHDMTCIVKMLRYEMYGFSVSVVCGKVQGLHVIVGLGDAEQCICVLYMMGKHTDCSVIIFSILQAGCSCVIMLKNKK